MQKLILILLISCLLRPVLSMEPLPLSASPREQQVTAQGTAINSYADGSIVFGGKTRVTPHGITLEKFSLAKLEEKHPEVLSASLYPFLEKFIRKTGHTGTFWLANDVRARENGIGDYFICSAKKGRCTLKNPRQRDCAAIPTFNVAMDHDAHDWHCLQNMLPALEEVNLPTVRQKETDIYAVSDEKIDSSFKSAQLALIAFNDANNEQRLALKAQRESLLEEAKKRNQLVRSAELAQYDQETARKMAAWATLVKECKKHSTRTGELVRELNKQIADSDRLLSEIARFKRRIPCGLHLQWLVAKDWAAEHPKTCLVGVVCMGVLCWVIYRGVTGQSILPGGKNMSDGDNGSSGVSKDNNGGDSSGVGTEISNGVTQIISGGAGSETAPAKIEWTDAGLKVAYNNRKEIIKYYLKDLGYSLNKCVSKGVIFPELKDWMVRKAKMKKHW